MPTASERAANEATAWRGIADRWSPDRIGDMDPSEAAVVVFYDPAEDLEHRAAEWGFTLRRPHLDELARFAAAIADVEAETWADDVPDLAMRAYEARRLLVGDRIVHWAVPWLDAVARSINAVSDAVTSDRDALLEIGDEMRIAPDLVGSEGLIVPGEDSFGPVAIDIPLHDYLRSVWSGEVLLGGAVDAVGAEEYRSAADRWRSLAAAHPGSARLWLDLADRADRTAGLLG